jgi:hypothetical protein
MVNWVKTVNLARCFSRDKNCMKSCRQICLSSKFFGIFTKGPIQFFKNIEFSPKGQHIPKGPEIFAVCPSLKNLEEKLLRASVPLLAFPRPTTYFLQLIFKELACLWAAPFYQNQMSKSGRKFGRLAEIHKRKNSMKKAATMNYALLTFIKTALQHSLR